jgi:hypothetical protein
VQNWRAKLEDKEDLSEEFALAARSRVGSDALRWFFRQPSHIEQLLSDDGALPLYEDSLVTRILVESRCDVRRRDPQEEAKWKKYAVRLAIENPDSLVRIEAGRLVAILVNGPDELEEVLSDVSSLEDFVLGLLSASQEYGIEEAAVGGEIPEALATLHMRSGAQDLESSRITDVLERLMSHHSRNIREGAAACLGYAAPEVFLQFLAGKVADRSLTTDSSRLSEYSLGIENAEGQLAEAYHGSMCPGMLSYLSPDEMRSEYERMRPILEPVISVCSSKAARALSSLLHELNPRSDSNEEVDEIEGTKWARPSLDRQTISLPFQENDEEQSDTK